MSQTRRLAAILAADRAPRSTGSSSPSGQQP